MDVVYLDHNSCCETNCVTPEINDALRNVVTEYNQEYAPKTVKQRVKGRTKFFTKIHTKNVVDTPNFWNTEYRRKFDEKVMLKGDDVKLTTGKDRLKPDNISIEDIPPETSATRFMDIYLSQTQFAHRYFNEHEQQDPLNMKNILTTYDIMKFPKSKGFGPKIMPNIDLTPPRDHRTIRTIKLPPKPVSSSMMSEMQAKFKPPTCKVPMKEIPPTPLTGSFRTTTNLPNHFQSINAYCFGNGKSPQNLFMF